MTAMGTRMVSTTALTMPPITAPVHRSNDSTSAQLKVAVRDSMRFPSFFFTMQTLLFHPVSSDRLNCKSKKGKGTLLRLWFPQLDLLAINQWAEIEGRTDDVMISTTYQYSQVVILVVWPYLLATVMKVIHFILHNWHYFKSLNREFYMALWQYFIKSMKMTKTGKQWIKAVSS